MAYFGGDYLLKEEEVEEGGMEVAAALLLLVLPWMRCKAAWRWVCAGRAVGFLSCCFFKEGVDDDGEDGEGSKKAWVDRDKMERET